MEKFIEEHVVEMYMKRMENLRKEADLPPPVFPIEIEVHNPVVRAGKNGCSQLVYLDEWHTQIKNGILYCHGGYADTYHLNYKYKNAPVESNPNIDMDASDDCPRSGYVYISTYNDFGYREIDPFVKTFTSVRLDVRPDGRTYMYGNATNFLKRMNTPQLAIKSMFVVFPNEVARVCRQMRKDWRTAIKIQRWYRKVGQQDPTYRRAREWLSKVYKSEFCMS
jgi:hypothetical protein